MKNISNEKQYQKFLKRVGYTGKYKNQKRKKYIPEKQEKVTVYESVGIGIAYYPTKTLNRRPISDIIIGQAYPKGNLQVLTKSEIRDPSTGKRR